MSRGAISPLLAFSTRICVPLVSRHLKFRAAKQERTRLPSPGRKARAIVSTVFRPRPPAVPLGRAPGLSRLSRPPAPDPVVRVKDSTMISSGITARCRQSSA
jgi:hypothetical protein